MKKQASKGRHFYVYCSDTFAQIAQSHTVSYRKKWCISFTFPMYAWLRFSPTKITLTHDPFFMDLKTKEMYTNKQSSGKCIVTSATDFDMTFGNCQLV